MNLRTLLIAAAFAGACMAGYGAELRRTPTQLIVSGDLLPTDLATVNPAGLREVVFEHSLGGNFAGAKRWIAFIQQHNLTTVVRGKCYSACALAFMAGNTRRADLSNGGSSVILLHSTRNEVNGVAFEGPDRFRDEIMAMLAKQAKLTPEVADMIRTSWAATAGVTFIAHMGIFKPGYVTYYCDNKPKKSASECKELANADPIMLGILTEPPKNR